MTRKGIRITSEIDAKDRGTSEAQLDQLQIWDAERRTEMVSALRRRGGLHHARRSGVHDPATARNHW